jgi:hypothetical protein
MPMLCQCQTIVGQFWTLLWFLKCGLFFFFFYLWVDVCHTHILAALLFAPILGVPKIYWNFGNVKFYT